MSTGASRGRLPPPARPPWVKVCGVTGVEEALAIAALGVEAIGLNFFRGSPRFLELDRARQIARALPGTVEKVGVFVNASAAEIARAVGEAGLDRVQLHGDEDFEFCAALRLPVLKALRPGPDWEAARAAAFRVYPILIDRYDRTRQGGTGRPADWSAARALVEAGYQVVLAGGLGPENVAEAVSGVAPFGVDLNSGVESAPGRKDPGLVARALRALGRPPESGRP